MLKRLKILFAVIFSIPLVIWFFSLGSFIKCKNIARYGIEATAEVVSYSSYLEVNGQKVYFVNYIFIDDNGNEHTGKSSSRFDYFEVKDMTTINIKYDKDFNSIEADFKFTNQYEIIFLPIIGMVGVGFLISLIVEIVNDQKQKYLLQNGVLKQITHQNDMTPTWTSEYTIDFVLEYQIPMTVTE